MECGKNMPYARQVESSALGDHFRNCFSCLNIHRNSSFLVARNEKCFPPSHSNRIQMHRNLINIDTKFSSHHRERSLSFDLIIRWWQFLVSWIMIANYWRFALALCHSFLHFSSTHWLRKRERKREGETKPGDVIKHYNSLWWTCRLLYFATFCRGRQIQDKPFDRDFQADWFFLSSASNQCSRWTR